MEACGHIEAYPAGASRAVPRAYSSAVPASRANARVTTRTGDGGETSLFGKGRVRKTEARIAALGDLDEAQSAIGLARSLAPRSSLGRELLELQRGLYVAMSEVATPREDLARLPQRLDTAAIERLDRVLDSVKKSVRIEGRFVIPGETKIAAAVDYSRTVTRRAERAVIACVDAGLIDGDQLLPWLNRASDLLFVLAHAAEGAPRPSKAAAATRTSASKTAKRSPRRTTR
jgi:cob(I)alamin adenosyltransferase